MILLFIFCKEKQDHGFYRHKRTGQIDQIESLSELKQRDKQNQRSFQPLY